MPTKQTFEVFLVVDSNGDYAVGMDYDDATEAYDNNIGGGSGRRIIKIKPNVALPEDEEVEVDVPDTAGETVAATAE